MESPAFHGKRVESAAVGVGLTELLEHGAGVADIGLTEEEKRELLAG